MIRVARLIRERSECEPYILFVVEYPQIERDVGVFRAERFS